MREEIHIAIGDGRPVKAPPYSERRVPEYRAYIVGRDGHFQDSVPLICADDAEAMEKAKQLVDGHDVELWQRACKIATFQHKPKIQF